MFKLINRVIAVTVIFCLVFEQSGFAQVAPQMPIPSYINGYVAPDRFRPVQLRSISFDSVKQDFALYLDKGDEAKAKPAQLSDAGKTLMQYFEIGLAMPNSYFWVNLRPDAPDQIIDPNLGNTDIGKVLLEADLQLKKDMARFTSPNTKEGREYWNKLYVKAEQLYGQDDISVPTVTRPWIVPGEIMVRESKTSAYILKATLKVMLEQDYLVDAKNTFSDARIKELNEYSSDIIRSVILPKLTREVNSSKKYAGMRQAYYSLILAQWFKAHYRGTDVRYASRIDNKVLEGLTSQQPWSKDTYFKAYKKSFEQGEYNISETVPAAGGLSVRQYFSGGADFSGLKIGGIMDGGLLEDEAVRGLQKGLVVETPDGVIIEDGESNTTQGADVSDRDKQSGYKGAIGPALWASGWSLAALIMYLNGQVIVSGALLCLVLVSVLAAVDSKDSVVQKTVQDSVREVSERARRVEGASHALVDLSAFIFSSEELDTAVDAADSPLIWKALDALSKERGAGINVVEKDANTVAGLLKASAAGKAIGDLTLKDFSDMKVVEYYDGGIQEKIKAFFAEFNAAKKIEIKDIKQLLVKHDIQTQEELTELLKKVVTDRRLWPDMKVQLIPFVAGASFFSAFWAKIVFEFELGILYMISLLAFSGLVGRGMRPAINELTKYNLLASVIESDLSQDGGQLTKSEIRKLIEQYVVPSQRDYIADASNSLAVKAASLILTGVLPTVGIAWLCWAYMTADFNLRMGYIQAQNFTVPPVIDVTNAPSILGAIGTGVATGLTAAFILYDYANNKIAASLGKFRHRREIDKEMRKPVYYNSELSEREIVRQAREMRRRDGGMFKLQARPMSMEPIVIKTSNADAEFVANRDIRPLATGKSTRDAVSGYVLAYDPAQSAQWHIGEIFRLKRGDFSPEEIEQLRAIGLDPALYQDGKAQLPVILYVPEAMPNHSYILDKANGMVAQKGGWTSFGQLYVRKDNPIPAVTDTGEIIYEGRPLRTGDGLTVDGKTGNIYAYNKDQQIPIIEGTKTITPYFDGGMEIVKLKNGSQEPDGAVKMVMASLSYLYTSKNMGDILAFVELVRKARNPDHKISSPKEEKTLKDLTFLRPDGTIHGTTRNIILSAVTGDGFNMSLSSPLANDGGSFTLDSDTQKGFDILRTKGYAQHIATQLLKATGSSSKFLARAEFMPAINAAADGGTFALDDNTQRGFDTMRRKGYDQKTATNLRKASGTSEKFAARAEAMPAINKGKDGGLDDKILEKQDLVDGVKRKIAEFEKQGMTQEAIGWKHFLHRQELDLAELLEMKANEKKVTWLNGRVEKGKHYRLKESKSLYIFEIARTFSPEVEVVGPSEEVLKPWYGFQTNNPVTGLYLERAKADGLQGDEPNAQEVFYVKVIREGSNIRTGILVHVDELLPLDGGTPEAYAYMRSLVFGKYEDVLIFQIGVGQNYTPEQAEQRVLDLGAELYDELNGKPDDYRPEGITFTKMELLGHEYMNVRMYAQVLMLRNNGLAPRPGKDGGLSKQETYLQQAAVLKLYANRLDGDQEYLTRYADRVTEALEEIVRLGAFASSNKSDQAILDDVRKIVMLGPKILKDVDGDKRVVYGTMILRAAQILAKNNVPFTSDILDSLIPLFIIKSFDRSEKQAVGWQAVELIFSQGDAAVGYMRDQIADGKLSNRELFIVKDVLEARAKDEKDGGLLSLRQERELLEKTKDAIANDSSMSLFQQRVAMEHVEDAVRNGREVRDELDKSGVLSLRQRSNVEKIVKGISDGGDLLSESDYMKLDPSVELRWLENQLEYGDHDQRIEAVKALASVNDENAVYALAGELKAYSTLIRRFAIQGLGIREDRTVAPSLIAALGSEFAGWSVRNDKRVVRTRIKLVRTVGLLGHRDAVDVLITALETDPSDFVRAYAAYELGRIGDERGRAALLEIQYNDNESNFLRKVAANVLIHARKRFVMSAESSKTPVDGGAPVKTGGIDFRALPVVSQPAVSPEVIAQGLAGMPMASAEEMDKSWAEIQKTMAQGQMPYAELKKFVTSCYAQKNDDRYRKAATQCVLNLLKLEEERAIATPDELKQIVIML